MWYYSPEIRIIRRYSSFYSGLPQVTSSQRVAGVCVLSVRFPVSGSCCLDTKAFNSVLGLISYFVAQEIGKTDLVLGVARCRESCLGLLYHPVCG